MAVDHFREGLTALHRAWIKFLDAELVYRGLTHLYRAYRDHGHRINGLERESVVCSKARANHVRDIGILSNQLQKLQAKVAELEQLQSRENV